MACEYIKDATRCLVYIDGDQVVFDRTSWNPDTAETIREVRPDAIFTTRNKYYGLGRLAILRFNYLYECYNELLAELVVATYGGGKQQEDFGTNPCGEIILPYHGFK